MCVAEEIPAYTLPYEREIGKTPSLGRMRELVVLQKYRPLCREQLYTHPITERIIKTMKDMWDAEPDGRITSACARDRLQHFHEAAMGKVSLNGSGRTSEAGRAGGDVGGGSGGTGDASPSAASSLPSLDGTARTDSSYECPSATGTTIPVGQLNSPYTPSTSTSSVNVYAPYQ